MTETKSHDWSLTFPGRRVLVIGGSTGIGNAMAQAFRALGAEVHITGTRPSAADYSAADVADLDGLTYHSLDLTALGAVQAWPLSFSSLDVLIQCQATTRPGGAEFEEAAFAEVVQANLTSMIACAEKFRAALAEAKGAMILVSSVAAFRTLRDQPAYTASKAGLLGLTRALAAAYIRDGVRVNGIAPGTVRTKMSAPWLSDPAMKARVLRAIPIGREAAPEEMVGAALFLASPLSSYVVGQTLVADGGMML
jgi:3-oxoacyl-[acyl-carrier protein] reductase